MKNTDSKPTRQTYGKNNHTQLHAGNSTSYLKTNLHNYAATLVICFERIILESSSNGLPASEVVKCFQNTKTTLECTEKLASILVTGYNNRKYAREAF